MNDDTTNHDRAPAAIEDMLADLGLRGAEAEQLRTLLGEVAGLARKVPEPSEDVRTLLGGSSPVRSRRRTVAAAAVAGALALGGVSAAAASNRLPSRVQEVVADATGGVVPHPVKPADRPDDAPGQDNPLKPTNAPDDAPGQIQKSTKPDPSDPGPAHPEDPGSHGREHNEANDTGAARFEDDDDDGPGHAAVTSRPDVDAGTPPGQSRR